MTDHELDQVLRGRIGSLIDRAPEAREWPGDRQITPSPSRRSHTFYVRTRPTVGRPVLVGLVLILVVGGVLLMRSEGSGSQEAEAAEQATDIVSADGRLYYLPSAEVDLSLGVEASTEPTVDEGSAIVVGRPTAAGYDRLAVIARLTTGPTFGEGDPITIAGRSLSQARYEGGGVAEPLPDGSWLEYQPPADTEVLSEIVAATTFEAGRIEFEETPSGVRKLATLTDVSGQRSMRFTYPDPGGTDSAEAEPALWFSILTTEAQHPDEVLAYAALAGAPMERAVVRGNPGFVSITADDGPSPTTVLWHSPTGHAAALFTNLPPNEAILFAESLRSVEQDRWQSEASP